jgi:hypothetical protein
VLASDQGLTCDVRRVVTEQRVKDRGAQDDGELADMAFSVCACGEERGVADGRSAVELVVGKGGVGACHARQPHK